MLVRDSPCGVIPLNSPRAGRQQGSTGSLGCAGSSNFADSVREAAAVNYHSRSPAELRDIRDDLRDRYRDLQAAGLSLDITRGKPSPARVEWDRWRTIGGLEFRDAPPDEPAADAAQQTIGGIEG